MQERDILIKALTTTEKQLAVECKEKAKKLQALNLLKNPNTTHEQFIQIIKNTQDSSFGAIFSLKFTYNLYSDSWPSYLHRFSKQFSTNEFLSMLAHPKWKLKKIKQVTNSAGKKRQESLLKRHNYASCALSILQSLPKEIKAETDALATLESSVAANKILLRDVIIAPGQQRRDNRGGKA